MKWKKPMVVVSLLLLLGSLGVYITGSPMGGVKIDVVDANGKAITDYGEVYYSVWTFDENGSFEVLKRGVLKGWLFFSGSTIELSKAETEKLRKMAQKMYSKTAFLGIDLWVVGEGKLYTLPPMSLELDASEGGLFATGFSLHPDFRDAIVTEIPPEKESRQRNSGGGGAQKEEPEFIVPIIPREYKWVTVAENSYSDVEIPVLIIRNMAWSDVTGTLQIGTSQSDYMGPEVTVAFGKLISKKTTFDPDSIKLKALGRSFTNRYRGGSILTVPKEKTWGYLWIKGKIHYIYQQEYVCGIGADPGLPGCEPTGNERYIAKIDEFSVSGKYGGVLNIKSGATLERPPYLPPFDALKQSPALEGPIGRDVYLENFFGEIYEGTDGYSFGIGVPVGALVNVLTGHSLPPWVDTLVVGFSAKGESYYAIMGEVRNNGPTGPVKFVGYKSSYKMSIPVKSPREFWKSDHVDTNVPVGFFIDVR
ncbi:hypothetical protein [Thermococcus zilligii]|uniref:hypothetical protein n=1 Tax=Thermococcus zilligii TaxID=54076 RepID=UPI000495825F|nr:hypothetical protein [Thermococcus zilligii]